MSRADRPIVPEAKAPARAAPAVDRRPQPTGRPLDSAVRGTMESRFGADFSQVRIHADQRAAEAARTAGAAAFTQGQDIVFGAGRYQPASSAGRELLAHELAHVLQQARGGADSDTEARADAAARAVSQGRSVAPQALGGAPLSVQAKPDDGASAGAGTTFAPQTLADFALNSAALPAEHADDIDKLAWSIHLHLGMRRSGRATIAVVGHTDRSGDEKTNLALGQQRAEAAKKALSAALKRQGVSDEQVAEIATSSMGEASPAVPTADGVQNAKNRRVEIHVNVGSQPVAAPTAPAQKPGINLFGPLPPSVLTPPQPVGPRRDPGQADLWNRMQENQKKIDAYDKQHPQTRKGLADAVIDTVMDKVADPLIKKLPVSKALQDLARTGLRKGLEKASEAGIDAAVDATGATGPEAEALKTAMKAALKTPPGGQGAPSP